MRRIQFRSKTFAVNAGFRARYVSNATVLLCVIDFDALNENRDKLAIVNHFFKKDNSRNLIVTFKQFCVCYKVQNKSLNVSFTPVFFNLLLFFTRWETCGLHDFFVLPPMTIALCVND